MEKIKISVIVPTNGKRSELTKRVLETLDMQSLATDMELIIVAEGQSLLDKINYEPTRLQQVTEILTPSSNGILLNFSAGAHKATGEYLFLLDDDMFLTDNETVYKLFRFLDNLPNVWAVGPFIDENKECDSDFSELFYDGFKRFFRLWDPDDYTNTIYSCFGKGSANYQTTLPTEPFIGCQWLTNQALLIRREIFLRYHKDDLEFFNHYQPIRRIWAVDFFMTFRLYLKKRDALAFLPSVRVLHLGAQKTSFDIGDRIVRETICAYYYHRRYLRERNFLGAYVLPCLGRFFYILSVNRHSLGHMLKNIYLLTYSLIILIKEKRGNLVNSPVYYGDTNVERPEEVFEVVPIVG